MGEEAKSSGGFKPGENGMIETTGAPRAGPGAGRKFGIAFVNALAADFKEHGEAVIEEVRQRKPEKYLDIITKVIPKTIDFNVSRFEGLTVDDLIRRIAAVRSQLDDLGIKTVGGIGAPAPHAELIEVRPIQKTEDIPRSGGGLPGADVSGGEPAGEDAGGIERDGDASDGSVS